MKLGPLYKGRFLKAWRKLQFEASWAGDASSPSHSSRRSIFGQVHRIVITTAEQAAMQTMESKVEHIRGALKVVANHQSQLADIVENKQSEIKEMFVAFRKQLDDREETLTTKLSAESERVREELKAKKSALEKHLESGLVALDMQNELILDPTMDAKERELHIERITAGVLEGIDSDGINDESQPIEVIVHREAVLKVH